MVKKKLLALYKGDTFLKIGTRQELAEFLGVLPRTITFYKTKTWKERSKEKSYLVIEIEDD